MLEAFSKQTANKLPPHRATDTKIFFKQVMAPPYHKSRPLITDENKVIKEWLDDQLAKAFITRSTSPAAAPILIARKPGGGVRICHDYLRLNAATIKNR
ncbi:hypothetical protein K470DRAFT_235374, partial [Piedraia hortae CBS 480.64]